MTHVERRQPRPGKETIHSGHFMVSHFEAEAQDDFDDLAVPVPDEEQSSHKVAVVNVYTLPGLAPASIPSDKTNKQQPHVSIETSLTKLFKCMSLAYRQKLTSPKWNRFKGIKLRWKDKIRLNNVIWRCWHMQFLKKQNTLVCQFASPLDVDTHVKPETIILEGKFWKRRAEAVIAEYKKWRMFHFTRIVGKGDLSIMDAISDMDTVESFSQCSDFAGNMLMDEDYLNLMSDTLFSTITAHQPFAFPDPREIARGANLADFIQPSLGPLQPNLDDFMDTLEPLHDLLSMTRLPPVPEESAVTTEDTMYRSAMTIDSYNTPAYIAENQNNTPPSLPNQMSLQGTANNTQLLNLQNHVKSEMQMYDNGSLFARPTDVQSNMMTQDMSYASAYDHSGPPAEPPSVYAAKASRVHYAAPQKTMSHTEPHYIKYNSGVPPSQTAPETVSLLQQPVQSPKSTIIMPGRSGYNREKARPRIAHFSSQLPSNQYQPYGQPAPPQATSPQSVAYDARQIVQRQSSPQMQYLQPHSVDSYKQNNLKTNANSRAFKMPSPPLSLVNSQQVSVPAPRLANTVPQKENYRSNSLPIGSQLNADWSIGNSGPQVADNTVARVTSRAREGGAPGALRYRSRSSSSGALGEAAAGGAGGAARRPPPLHSVASEPTLPQASVMLARLLHSNHSQNVYKLNSSAEEGINLNDSINSPIRRGQISPVNTDVMSPHHSASPSTSPPPSPGAGGRSPGSPREPRRSTHMHAEQKRRYNIKSGFDTLQALIPHLNNNPAAKISKAAMLQKGAEYIKQLKTERDQIKEEIERLKQQIDRLNNSISNCHSLLPATGAPVSRARAGRLREMFARHVAHRTAHNWKYWLFSMVAAALVDTFSSCVSCGSGADLVRTTLLWAEQHCSLVEMRPAVLNSLRQLCTATDILTSPERLPEEARAAAAANSSVKTEPT